MSYKHNPYARFQTRLDELHHLTSSRKTRARFIRELPAFFVYSKNIKQIVTVEAGEIVCFLKKSVEPLLTETIMGLNQIQYTVVCIFVYTDWSLALLFNLMGSLIILIVFPLCLRTLEKLKHFRLLNKYLFV